MKEAGREKLFSHKYVKLFCQDKHKTTFRTCISRLLSQKLIKKDYNDIVGLTELGKKKAMHSFIKAESLLYKVGEAKWDGGWRIVLFDMPESKRNHRDYLRKTLKMVGFREFQKSIWVYPYPVPPFLKQLLFEDNIKPHIKFITTNLVDDDSELKKVFGL